MKKCFTNMAQSIKVLCLSLFLFCLSVGVADACGCTRSLGTYTLVVSWESPDCKNASGLAIIEGYDNGKYQTWDYFSISFAVDFCNL